MEWHPNLYETKTLQINMCYLNLFTQVTLGLPGITSVTCARLLKCRNTYTYNDALAVNMVKYSSEIRRVALISVE